MSETVTGVDVDVDFMVPEDAHSRRTGVKVTDGEVTIRQQHAATLGADYWQRVTLWDGELQTLYDGLQADDVPDKLRGGAWQTDADVRPDGDTVTLVQSSAGAGGRNGDSVRLTEATIEAILTKL